MEDKRRTEDRKKEYERTAHTRMLAQERVLAANALSDDRVEAKRLDRFMAQQTREVEMNRRLEMVRPRVHG